MVYLGALIICLFVVISLMTVAGYYGGLNECKKGYCSDLSDNDSIIKHREDTLNVSLLILSVGIAVGLIVHGFPFKFDFRRSTVYNEYSEDDDEDVIEDN